jgi:hypothetical protein
MTKPTPGPRPTPRTTKTSLVLDTDLLLRFKLHAVAQRTDMSTIVRTLIEDYLAARDAPSKTKRTSR